MKSTIKIIALLALTNLSLPVFAEATGEAQVRAAAEGTVTKIEEAIGLMEKSADKESIATALAEARQLQKEFRYERTERQRQRASGKLRQASDEFEKGDKAAAEATLKASLESYKEMLKIYKDAH